MIKRRVYVDMDGTIADLYTEINWLDKLRAEQLGLFENLSPMISQEELLDKFPLDKYDLCVLSMTPLDASQEYCQQVIKEKDLWLDKHFPVLSKRIYKKYGHNKNLKNSANAILIDDNETIRKNWKGVALNPAQLWG